MKCGNLLLSVVLVVVVLVLAVVAMAVRHQMRVREYRQHWARIQEINRAHTDHAPPPDYHKWIQGFGANEPDPSTAVGRAALDTERARLPAAKERLQRLVEQLPTVFASEDDLAESAFMTNVLKTLDGFSRASCAAMLTSISWGGCGGEKLRNMLIALGPVRGAKAVERYYKVICMMVDLLWTRGGLEFEAAEADIWTYSSLRSCRYLARRNRWQAVDAVIGRCQDHWKEFRCDSESSNFCRAHRFWEERYNLYYRERVKRGETNWLKILSAYYRYHLEQARKVLNREPKWSPGVGHGLYDDAPGGVKP